MQEEKVGFFRKMKKAIFNFEEYNKFAQEKISKTFGYLFKIIIIITIIISSITTYTTYKIFENIIEIFKNEAPYFSIENGILKIENDQKFKYIDEDNYFGIIIDPTKDDMEEIEYSEGIAFLKEKIYVKANNQTTVVNYSNIIENDFNKYDVESILTNKNLVVVYTILGIILFITNFVVYTCEFLLNTLLLSVIGLLTNQIAKTKLNYGKIFRISVYSLTLPIILLMIYSIITILTNFTIKYFDIAYDAISYIYVMTAIFMMKSEGIKNKQEIEQTVRKEDKSEEKKTDEQKKKDKSKEEKDKSEKEKDKSKENKKQKNEGSVGEPNGSKA